MSLKIMNSHFSHLGPVTGIYIVKRTNIIDDFFNFEYISLQVRLLPQLSFFLGYFHYIIQISLCRSFVHWLPCTAVLGVKPINILLLDAIPTFLTVVLKHDGLLVISNVCFSISKYSPVISSLLFSCALFFTRDGKHNWLTFFTMMNNDENGKLLSAEPGRGYLII